MDQISELKRSEKRQKEALMAVLVLIEELIADLHLEPAKASRFKEQIRAIQLQMR